MWFTIGFGGACAFGAYCYVPWMLPVALLFVLLSVLFGVLTKKKLQLRIGCAVCLGIAAGLAFFWGYNEVLLQNARAVDGKTERVSIEVTDYSYATQHGCGFDGRVTLEGKTYNVRVYLNKYERLEPGHRVRGNFRFQVTFDDAQLTKAGNGIFLIAKQDGNFVPQKYWTEGWIHAPAIWRQSIIDKITDTFPEDTQGFARALLLGDRTGIDYETNTAFKISGISHVIAVSGLHVSILFALVYCLAGKKRVLTAILGIPAVVLFAAVAGFTPSITRACIMQILMMLALLLEKEYDPPTALSFAALVMLIGNPLVITSVSFQLSVSCMAGIFLFAPRILAWLMDDKRFGRWRGKLVHGLCSCVAATLGAIVMTTPLVAIYFGCVSLISMVTNLLTLWLITFIFYGIMLSCAVGYLSAGIAQAVAWVISWAIRYVLETAKVLSSFSLAAVYTKSVYIVIWLISCYLLLFVYLTIRKRPVALFSSLVLCGFCVALAFSWIEPAMSECRVTALDVGQGQAILLQSEGKTFLVDCGGDYDEDAADITAETLLSQGISKLDGVILTHYDRDHCGGMEYLLSRVGTQNLFLPHAEDPDGVAQSLQNVSDGELHIIKEDTLLTYGDVKITIFAPLSYKSGNESSMCVLFQTEKCDILITGDRDIQTENMLLSRRELPKLELLIAGHHGAKTSTGELLLEKTKPEYVFISVGSDNPYGHPADEVLLRLAQFGCVVYCTDDYGTLIYKG